MIHVHKPISFCFKRTKLLLALPLLDTPPSHAQLPQAQSPWTPGPFLPSRLALALHLALSYPLMHVENPYWSSETPPTWYPVEVISHLGSSVLSTFTTAELWHL